MKLGYYHKVQTYWFCDTILNGSLWIKKKITSSTEWVERKKTSNEALSFGLSGVHDILEPQDTIWCCLGIYWASEPLWVIGLYSSFHLHYASIRSKNLPALGWTWHLLGLYCLGGVAERNYWVITYKCCTLYTGSDNMWSTCLGRSVKAY